jgi:hypothetical protein
MISGRGSDEAFRMLFNGSYSFPGAEKKDCLPRRSGAVHFRRMFRDSGVRNHDFLYGIRRVGFHE